MENRLVKAIARRRVTAPTHSAVQRAIKEGTINKPSFCEFCARYGDKSNGALRMVAHHCDYSKPLEVTWMCTKHHNAWHRVFEALNKEGETSGVVPLGFIPAIRGKSRRTNYGLAKGLRDRGIDISNSAIETYEQMGRSGRMRYDVLCGLRKVAGMSWSEFGKLLDEEFFQAK